MRKGLFWLNDKQWARIEPHCHRTRPDRRAMTIDALSAYYSHASVRRALARLPA